MNYQTYVRKPFNILAMEVTLDNLDEVAELIGTVKEENGKRFIQVDKKDPDGKPIVPTVFRVYPGFWLTKIGKNIRCYKKSAFNAQFTKSTPDIEEWVEFMNGGRKRQKAGKK